MLFSLYTGSSFVSRCVYHMFPCSNSSNYRLLYIGLYVSMHMIVAPPPEKESFNCCTSERVPHGLYINGWLLNNQEFTNRH
jgi:hypothetical protein